MKRRNIASYLRTHRLKSSLTQDEIAFLLGTFDRTHVSRHETGERVPLLADILAYELLFDVRIGSLYETRQIAVAERVRSRARALHASLAHRQRDPLRDVKRKLLKEIIKRCSSKPQS